MITFCLLFSSDLNIRNLVIEVKAFGDLLLARGSFLKDFSDKQSFEVKLQSLHKHMGAGGKRVSSS